MRVSASPKKSVYQFGKIGWAIRYIIKPILLKVLCYVDDKIPAPVPENLWHPNSHLMLGLYKEFVQRNLNNYKDGCEALDAHGKAYLGFMKLIIALYEFDHWYRERFDWAVWKLKAMPWVVINGEERVRPQWWRDDDFVFGGKSEKNS